MNRAEDRINERIDRASANGVMSAQRADVKRDARWTIRLAVEAVPVFSRKDWLRFAAERLFQACIIAVDAHFARTLFASLAKAGTDDLNPAKARALGLPPPANDGGRSE